MQTIEDVAVSRCGGTSGHGAARVDGEGVSPRRRSRRDQLDGAARLSGAWKLAAGCVFVGAIALFGVAAGAADRLPLTPWIRLPTLLLAGFGFRALMQPVGWFRSVAIVAVAAIAGAVAAVETGGSAYDAIIGSPVIGAVTLVGVIAAAIAFRVLRSRERATRTLRAFGGVALAASYLFYPYGLIAHDATVFADHRAGRRIDERRGSYRGVRLGDPAGEVKRVFGRAPVWQADQKIEPLQGGDLFDGPSSVDYTKPPRDTFLRYAHVAFAVRDGNVRWIQINDANVATATGVGPGDSMTLVRRAYPNARCSEDSIHAEPDYIPYPVCVVHAGSRRWLTFFGSYQDPGTPVLAIWLSTRRLE